MNGTYFAVYETQAAIQDIRLDFARLPELRPFTVAVFRARLRHP
jgi:hypothetical protein